MYRPWAAVIIGGITWALVGACDTGADGPAATDHEHAAAVTASSRMLPAASVRVEPRAFTQISGAAGALRSDLTGGPTVRRPEPASPFAFPFAASFDTGTELDAWTLRGAWRPSAAAPFSGDGHLRGDPAHVELPGDAMEAAMKGFVALPLDAPSHLALWYRANLTGEERVVVEAQASDAAEWVTLTTVDATLSGAGYSRMEIPLHAWAGRSVRARLRLEGAGVAGLPCVMDVDEVRIEALPARRFTFPFATGFDSADERAAWHVAGVWTTGGAADAVAAETALADGHELTMAGFVRVPEGRPATLSYRYQAQLGDGDWLVAQVQSQEAGAWETVGAYTGEHARAAWTLAEHDMSAWGGESVRVRFAVRYAATGTVRTAQIDDVRIGGLVGPLASVPWEGDFDVADGAYGWALSGAWDWIEDAAGEIVLSANPDGAPQGALERGHVAMTRGFIAVESGMAPVAAFELAGELADQADRVLVEVQRRSDGVWRLAGVFGPASVRPEGAWQEVSLAGFAGDAVRVRLRLAWGPTLSVRRFEVRSASVVDAVAAVAPYPYMNGFEGAADLDGWSLSGSWGLGAGVLDGNPDALTQSGSRTAQTAVMYAFVQVPAVEAAEVSFSWRLQAAHASDALFLEAQADDGGDWRILALIDADAAQGSDGWGVARAGLDAYAGGYARFRLRLVTGPSEVARVIEIDDFAVGPVAAE